MIRENVDNSDDALIRRIERGDKAAMRVLYERHSNGLTAFARNRLKDPFEAADVVQETFLEVWTKASTFEARASVRSWMFSIARNKAVDRIRKSAKVIASEPDETIVDDGPAVETIVSNAQDAERVQHCLSELSDAQRAAVTLSFFEEMTYREIAETESVSESTVKSRIHYAKKLLMHCLSKP
ncbi:MAG: RNA polymerase sigma factor [Pseudomonadota bacterium]